MIPSQLISETLYLIQLAPWLPGFQPIKAAEPDTENHLAIDTLALY